jgi:hypothetical protein
MSALATAPTAVSPQPQTVAASNLSEDKGGDQEAKGGPSILK